jgi:hypothetical protein
MAIRKYLYWIVAALFLYYLVRNREDLVMVGRVILEGTWYWILGALLLQVLHYIAHGSALRAGFAAVSIERRKRDCVSITLAALAVNVAAPSMNVAGAAFVVDEAKKHGFSAVKSVAAVAITVLTDGMVFICGSILVAILLFSKQELSPSVLLGIMFLTAIILSLMTYGIYLWKRPHRANWLFGVLGKERALRWKEEWGALTSMKIPSGKFWHVGICEFWSHVTNLLSLVLLFMAFGIDPINLIPIVAYMVSVLFVIFSPTPMGIGFAEGGMALTMVGMGVPEAQATAITIAFRGLSFWLPLLFGAGFLHRMKVFNSHSHATS